MVSTHSQTAVGTPKIGAPRMKTRLARTSSVQVRGIPGTKIFKFKLPPKIL